MAIDYRIDKDLRIVFAVPHGTLVLDDLVAYQREAWSQAEAVSCDELVDMSEVREIEYESPDQMKRLAQLSTRYDRPGSPPPRMAIVAPGDLAFGVSRMYEAMRGTVPGSNKEVQVFRDYDEALRWLAGEEGRRGPGE